MADYLAQIQSSAGTLDINDGTSITIDTKRDIILPIPKRRVQRHDYADGHGGQVDDYTYDNAIRQFSLILKASSYANLMTIVESIIQKLEESNELTLAFRYPNGSITNYSRIWSGETTKTGLRHYLLNKNVMLVELTLETESFWTPGEVAITPNTVIDGALKYDNDGDGVANSWVDDDNGAITVTKSIDNNEAQKIDVTGGAVTGYAGIKQEIEGFSSGDDTSSRIEVKATGANLSVDQSQVNSGQFSDKTVKGDDYAAQTFQAGYSGPIVKVDVYIGKTGSPANLIMELKNVSAGDPGSTVYATEEIDAGDIGGPGIHSFTFTSPYLGIATTDYAIVLRQKNDGGDSSNYYTLWGHSLDVYVNGAYKYTEDGGSSWSTHLIVFDLYFQVYIPDVHYDIYVEYTGSGIDVRLLLNQYLAIATYTEKYYANLPVDPATTNIWFHVRVVVNKAGGLGTLYVKKAGFYEDTVIPTSWYENRFTSPCDQLFIYDIPGDVPAKAKMNIKNLSGGVITEKLIFGLEQHAKLQATPLVLNAGDANAGGVAEATAHDNECVKATPDADRTDIDNYFVFENDWDLKRRYRVYSRIYDTNADRNEQTMTIGTWFSKKGAWPYTAAQNTWELHDLGEHIPMLAIAPAYMDETYTMIAIYDYTSDIVGATAFWYDFFALVPVDMACGVFDCGQVPLDDDNTIVIDGFTDMIYQLNSAGLWRGSKAWAYTGDFLVVPPGDSRMAFIQEDIINEVMEVSLSYEARYLEPR